MDMRVSVEKETPYLKETREYIESLKDNLIKRILVLQQNKKTGINSRELSQNANATASNKFLFVTEENWFIKRSH